MSDGRAVVILEVDNRSHVGGMNEATGATGRLKAATAELTEVEARASAARTREVGAWTTTSRSAQQVERDYQRLVGTVDLVAAAEMRMQRAIERATKTADEAVKRGYADPQAAAALLTRVRQQQEQLVIQARTAAGPQAAPMDAATAAIKRNMEASAQAGRADQEALAQKLRVKRAYEESLTPVVHLTAATRNYTAATQEGGKQTGLTTFQLQNLGFQINDVAVGLLSGQQAWRILVQQGPQISQAVGGWSAAFQYLRSPVALAAAGVAALVGSFVLGVARAQSLDSSLKRLGATLRSTGNASGMRAADVQSQVLSFARQPGVSRDASQQAAQNVLANPLISADVFARVLPLARDFAVVTGQDIPAAAKALSDALTGGYQAAQKLDQQFQFLSISERSQIRDLSEQGRTTEAARVTLGAFERQIKGTADQALTPMAKATSDLGNAWDKLLDSLSKTGTIKAASSAITNFLTDLAKGINGGSDDPIAARRAELDRLTKAAEKAQSLLARQGTDGGRSAVPGYDAFIDRIRLSNVIAAQNALAGLLPTDEINDATRLMEQFKVAAEQAGVAVNKLGSTAFHKLMTDAEALVAKFDPLTDQQRVLTHNLDVLERAYKDLAASMAASGNAGTAEVALLERIGRSADAVKGQIKQANMALTLLAEENRRVAAMLAAGASPGTIAIKQEARGSIGATFNPDDPVNRARVAAVEQEIIKKRISGLQMQAAATREEAEAEIIRNEAIGKGLAAQDKANALAMAFLAVKRALGSVDTTEAVVEWIRLFGEFNKQLEEFRKRSAAQAAKSVQDQVDSITAQIKAVAKGSYEVRLAAAQAAAKAQLEVDPNLALQPFLLGEQQKAKQYIADLDQEIDLQLKLRGAIGDANKERAVEFEHRLKLKLLDSDPVQRQAIENRERRLEAERKINDVLKQSVEFNKANDPAFAIQKEIEAFRELEAQGKLTQKAIDNFNESMAIKTGRAGESWIGGLQAGLLDFARTARNVGDQVASAMVQALSAGTDALARIMVGLRVDFKSLLIDLRLSLARAFIGSALTGPLAGLLAGGLGAGARFLPGGGAPIMVGGQQYVPVGGGAGGGNLFTGGGLGDIIGGIRQAFGPGGFFGSLFGGGGSLASAASGSAVSGAGAAFGGGLNWMGGIGGLLGGALNFATGNPIGGIAGLLGGALSFIPGLGPIGGIIGALGGILGGLTKKKPKSPQGVSNLAWTDGSWISSVAMNRGKGNLSDGTGKAAGAVGDIIDELTGLYGLGLGPGTPGGFLINSVGKNTGNLWQVGLGTYAHPQQLPAGFQNGGSTVTAAYTSPEEAVSALAAMIVKAGAAGGSLTGLTATQQQVLRSEDVLTIENIKAALDFSQTYDDIVRGNENITATEKAIRDLNTQFRGLKVEAERYGLEVEIIEQRRREAIDKTAGDFMRQFTDPMLAKTPQGQLQIALRDLDKQRELDLAAAAYLETITDNLIDINAIEEFYGDQRIEIEKRILGTITDNYKAAIDAIRLTPETSTLTPRGRLDYAENQLSVLEGRAYGGEFIATDEALSAGNNYLTALRTIFASGEGFAAGQQRLIDLYRFLGNIPGYAEGGAFGSGLKWFGERGPELVATGPGYAMTHQQSMAMAGGGSRELVDHGQRWHDQRQALTAEVGSAICERLDRMRMELREEIAEARRELANATRLKTNK